MTIAAGDADTACLFRTASEDDASARTVSRIRSTGELLGEILDLTAGSAIRGFGVQHERLPPRRRSSSTHAHSHKEEFVYVLRGRPLVSIDGDTRRLQPNDAVAFAAGTGIAHAIVNDTDETVEFLVVSTNSPEDVVTYSAADRNGKELPDGTGEG